MQNCPECGAPWDDGLTCADHYHQMLIWDYEHTDFAVHHLMVLCYYLQHPSLYTPEGLEQAKGLLADFVARGQTPQEVRQQSRAQVDSSKRTWKIKGTATAYGSYPQPIPWTMTAADVVAGGVESYCEQVWQWAQTIYEMFQAE
jgi:hypothetical protein